MNNKLVFDDLKMIITAVTNEITQKLFSNVTGNVYIIHEKWWFSKGI